MTKNDIRLISTGDEIPTKFYSDQPYVVKTDDGAWLCVTTTGNGREGEHGQHVISSRSTDKGKTWSDPVAVESPEGPEASYAVALKADSGRIYVFYNHNTDDLRWVRADDPPYKDGKCYRVDSMGYFVFKYSDDHGRTWSEKRYTIPVREMAIDRENPYQGEIRYFWNVGKPIVSDGAAYVSLHKVGGLGNGFFTRSEGVLLKSANILTEPDPEQITWETLPDGDAGLRTPPGGGLIAEEQSYVVLSDGSFYSVYRTIDGHPACAYSRDGGHTWSVPQYKQYANGRLMKHPRAANFAWGLENGKFLYWYHNHGGNWYEDRNPVWLSGGVEADTPEGRVILWSQPEIVLYDDDPYIRMSYPDLIEEDGKVYLTETQKDAARTHELDNAMLDALWNQLENKTRTSKGQIFEQIGDMPVTTTMPLLPKFNQRNPHAADYGTLDLRAGFTVECWLTLTDLEAGQVLLDTRTASGQGLALQTTPRGTIEIIMNDGRTENRWDCDPDMLKIGEPQHLVVVVDGGPKLILFYVDGVLCDGGTYRQFGWGRYNPNLRHVNGQDQNRVISPGNKVGEEISPSGEGTASSQSIALAPDLHGTLHVVRVYDRPLLTSEVIGNYNAGM